MRTFRAARGQRGLTRTGGGAFYTLLLMGFSLPFQTWWPVLAFWGLTGNRMLGLFVGQAPVGDEKAYLWSTWGAAVLFYVVFALATAFLPVPALGVTPEVIRRQEFPVGGLWPAQPYRVMAFGFLYFTAMAWSEMTGYRWPRRGTGRPSDR